MITDKGDKYLDSYEWRRTDKRVSVDIDKNTGSSMMSSCVLMSVNAGLYLVQEQIDVFLRQVLGLSNE